MAKRKPKTIAALVNDAAAILQRVVRLKAADENGYCACVCCGRVEPWQNMDGGHFISRRYTAHKLLEENIHPSCKGCNGYLGGNLAPYTLWMVETYGTEFVQELINTKGETRKYGRVEIEEIIHDLKHYEKQIREQKSL